MLDSKKEIIIYQDDEINIYQQWLVLKKRKKLIVIITFFVLTILTLYIFITPNIYKTNFVLQTNIISPFQVKMYIDSISNLIKDKNYNILSSQLKIKNIQAIKKIQATIPRGQKDLVIIQLKITNPSIINKIENSLLNYINNQPEVINEINTQKTQLLETISILKQQIGNLTKLKEKIFNNKELINNSSIKIDPLQIELSIQDCKDKIIQAQAELKNLQAVKLAVDAIVPQKPYWPKPKILIPVAIFSGLFFALFLAFFLEWLENAKKRFEQEHKSD